MNVNVAAKQEAGQAVTHFDVLIVGAGISGIDAAYHLQQNSPDRTFALLENQESFGGTWRTHTYPGIRSDSDLFTFGYGWKPWHGKPIASADKILNYLDEVLDEQDIRRHIRFSHQVRTATWSSDDQTWTLEIDHGDSGETSAMTCSFLWMCQGYYKHKAGYTPDFPGMDSFKGQIVHPQRWPEDLDYTGKRVVVIGSGATAATLIPAMADDCEHITMLQRSPTYFAARPNVNELAEQLRSLDIPDAWTHEIVRRNILREQRMITAAAVHNPEGVKDQLLTMAKEYLGDDFDIEKHFTPSYRPWQQRLALIPDGDLYQKLKSGKASVATDHIDTFTETGIRLQSGEELDADIIVTATGFDMAILGDIAFTIDGKPMNFADRITWRGFMYSDFPNMAWVFGYFRSSWTLRADLISAFVTRLLNHMAAKGVKSVTPKLRDNDRNMTLGPFIDPENFNPGYVTRSIDRMPRQGDHEPWLFEHDYHAEKDILPKADLEDGSLIYR